MVNYLIRVGLPDRPGALGAVASRIGSVGADVISIDILQRDHGVVVDELGVRLAGEHLIRLLRDEILEVDGVSIESMQPVEGDLPDRHAELLDMVSELFRQTSPTGLLAHLVIRVRRSLVATFAVVLDEESGEVVASDGEVPGVDRLLAMARRGSDPESPPAGVGSEPGGPAGGATSVEDIAVAAVCLDHAGFVLVVGRGEPVLRARERRWISIMAELADLGWRELV